MKQIILGTDWWADCDDAVAVRLITRFAKAGRIRFLGVGINACMEYSVASLRGFLTADGMADVPIGIDRGALDYGGTPCYQKPLAERMQIACTNDDAEDAVRLYRRLLAESDGGVEIVEIGFLQVIVGVLQSPPDDLSDKCGLDLVREKVAKV